MINPIQEFAIYLAIDPGSTGGIAVYRAREPVVAHAMPPTEADVLHLLRELSLEPARCIAFVELVGGFIALLLLDLGLAILRQPHDG